MYRVGTGWDAHRFCDGRPLKLGGITIPYGKGLEGHSDADALAHAVCDALLGAAGLTDIGNIFPDDDPKYENIDSLELLAEVKRMIEKNKFRIVNVDSVIIAQAPRLSQYLPDMKQRIAATLGLEPGRVGVKASSPEGLGGIGRAEGIAAQCVACLAKVDET
jgi:2-C-methyl-D-erythritol 2,4-cyclodiphosphate synthase